MPRRIESYYETKGEVSRIVGRNVRKRREQLGMTQTELARRIGAGQNYLSHIEAGHTGRDNHPGVTVDLLVAFAKILKTDANELVSPCPIFVGI